MKESEINVTDLLQLADEWFDMAFDSIETQKEIIEFLSLKHGYNFYDNEEDLLEDDAKLKSHIKADIAVPLAMDMEYLLKSLVIRIETEFRPNGQRGEIVKNIFREVKSIIGSNTNFHDLSMYIEYLNQYEDELFIDILASLYIGKRKGKGNFASRENRSAGYIKKEYTPIYPPAERIDKANQKYKNSFIDFRYPFETQDTEEAIDLVKLIDYAEAVRDICIYYKLKKEVFQVIKGTPGINVYFWELQFSKHLKDILDKSNNGITNIELINIFKDWIEDGYGEANVPPEIQQKINAVIEKINSIGIPSYAIAEHNSNEKNL